MEKGMDGGVIALKLRNNTGLMQTCGACPTQWEQCNADGTFLYFRYRHGRMSISFWRSEMDYHWTHTDAIKSYEESIGDEYDGYMEDTEALMHIYTFMVRR